MEQKSSLNRFIEELQALEEGTKRKVLIVGTILAMAVVIYLWAGYFGSLITAIPQEQPPVAQAGQGTTAAPGQSPSSNFFQDMKNGMANIYNTLRGPQQYDVKP